MAIKKSFIKFLGIYIVAIPVLIGSALGTSLVVPGARVELVKSGYQGTEGPAADAEGNVYFSEKGGNSVQKWSWKDGKVSTHRVLGGGAIGMMFDAQGRLVMCEFSGNVTRDDMKGNVTVIADSADGKKLHIPNDLWIDPAGGIYFTDFAFLGMGPGGPDAGIPSGTGGPMVSPMGGLEATTVDDLGICYISPDGKTVTRVLKGVNANGLIGTPDGKILYTTGEGGICSHQIKPDGSVSNKKLFCEDSTDGMAMDEHQNVIIPRGGREDEKNIPGYSDDCIRTDSGPVFCGLRYREQSGA